MKTIKALDGHRIEKNVRAYSDVTRPLVVTKAIVGDTYEIIHVRSKASIRSELYLRDARAVCVELLSRGFNWDQDLAPEQPGETVDARIARETAKRELHNAVEVVNKRRRAPVEHAGEKT